MFVAVALVASLLAPPLASASTHPVIDEDSQARLSAAALEQGDFCAMAQYVAAGTNDLSVTDRTSNGAGENFYDELNAFLYDKPEPGDVPDEFNGEIITNSLTVKPVADLPAYEMMCKMKSAQFVVEANGGEIAEDFTEPTCADVNQFSLDYARNSVSEASRDRYDTYGVQMSFGPDLEKMAGPEWVFSPLVYSPGVGSLMVTAPSLITPTDPADANPLAPPANGIFGNHYCKVLSPLAAVEWVLLGAFIAPE